MRELEPYTADEPVNRVRRFIREDQVKGVPISRPGNQTVRHDRGFL